MSLLDSGMEPCTVYSYSAVDDGYGGDSSTWVPSETPIQAAITLDLSTEARKAAVEGAKNLYTVTVRKDVSLMTGEVIQRLSDGKYLRITSDGTDKKTPAMAGLNMRQVSAEEMEGLPNG